MSEAWIRLVIAGVLEVCWAVGLKYTQGFTRPIPSLMTGTAIVMSMYLLSVSAKELPIGTAYAVWVGIGALGSALMGIILFNEPINALRLSFLLMLLVSVLGLKMTSP